MTLSEELTWRGFVNQTTFKDLTVLDGQSIRFYWGVDPSADSMTIGNLAAAMMVKCFIKHGHQPVLLVGGATGMIGDPDGKKDERHLKTIEEIEHNKRAIAAQYHQIFEGAGLELVDNYDWFKGIGYLEFLRTVGKHVPMRQMLSRDFIQSRLGEDGAGISYAEFSYALIQGYDFLHLHRELGVTLQVAGADQWGNSIAGVDLIRRITGDEVNVYTVPLIVNKSTGVKFGKSESGAVWLDHTKTSPTDFYQFWINLDDAGVEDYLKVYTELDKTEIDRIMEAQHQNPRAREAQICLATEVTRLVHGQTALELAKEVTALLTGQKSLESASEDALHDMKKQIKSTQVATADVDVAEVLVASGLCASNSEARRLIQDKAVYVNGQKLDREQLQAADFQSGRLLLRRGKAFKDSAIIELAA